MVYRNLAKFYCDLCGNFIKERLVNSPSENRQVKITFDTCENCRSEFHFYGRQERCSYYDDLAILHTHARVLIDKPLITKHEKSLLREYLRAQHLIFDTIIRGKRRGNFKEILKEVRDKLRLLSDVTVETSKIVERYRSRISIIDALRLIPPERNPAIRFKEYIHRKMKKSLK
ncbi:MAG: hypothetical protein OEZ35_00155 [Candidatus Bathyarchaeota archaeon]|nr:hypothetical protein [Candidatus Bathyarchaeota archaeon]